MAYETMHQVIYIPAAELDKWGRLLRQKSVDYTKENLPRFSCVFVKTVKFSDGILADLKVCTSDTGQDVWSEMVVYDEHGHELWVSEVSDRLSGPWEFELKNVYGNGDRVQKYVVDVVEDKEMEIDTVYDRLGCTRDDFCTMLLQEIEDGITSEYSAKIADAIADKVAVDVMETADQKEWNTCDISLGVGRVLLKTLGIDV